MTPLLWTQRLQPIRASNQFPPANEKRDFYTTQPIRAAINLFPPANQSSAQIPPAMRKEIFYNPTNWQII